MFTEMAEEMVKGGYAALGYNQINIDDWLDGQGARTCGRLQADSKRFPSGMPVLVSQLHTKGLKVGIYGNMGRKTCMGFPGSYGP